MSSSNGGISQYVNKASAIIIAVVIAAGAAVVVPIVSGGAGTVANVWVDSNGGTCTRQGTAGAYSDAGACSSFATAYGAAASSDVIMVKAGSYASQTISGGTKALTLRGAPGESVSVSGLNILNTSNLTLTGDSWANLMDVGELDVDYGGGSAANDGDTLSYLHSHIDPTGACLGCDGASFFRGVTNLLVQHSEFGPSNPDDGIKLWPPLSGDTGAENDHVHFDDIHLHDIIHTADASVHDDGFSIEQGSNITLSRFKTWNCGTQCLYTQCDALGPGTIGPVTIENSMIGEIQSYGTFTIMLRGECSATGPYTLRNNTILGAAFSDGSVPYSVIGNVWATWNDDFACPLFLNGASTASYNVNLLDCGGDATNVVDSGVGSDLVDETQSSNMDLHLSTGASSAVDVPGFTLAHGCATTDYDGAARPSGALCDAGADEYGVP